MSRFTGQGLICARGGRVVFAELDFQIADGEALMLTGANGSGKSSLLRLMAGLARPAAGTIAWDGGAVADDPEAHAARLHYVGHLDAIKPALTVAENVALWSGLRGSGGGDRNDLRHALAGFGLDRLADASARLLSAGQRRRVALARVVAAPARLWLLDEPTVALDRDGIAALLHVLARHRAAGGLAVISTNVEVDIPEVRVLDVAAFAPLGEAAWDGLA
jgi:heme exporter protein A